MSVVRAIKLLSLFRGLVKSDFQQATRLMGEMHGLPQKLGQHLTLYPAREFGGYFDNLCVESRTEQIPVAEVLNELGLTGAQAELAAQASIGQVYLVSSDDGLLAVKIKYPRIEQKIKADFSILHTLAWPLRFLPLRNSSVMPMLNYLKTAIMAECDYVREAEIQGAFHQVFQGNGEILVPAIAAGNARAIASPWIAGDRLLNRPDRVDGWFVETYLKFILTSLNQLGMVHADPHPGNFILPAAVQDGTDRHLAVIDFGSVITFAPHESNAVRRLLLGGYGSAEELAADLAALGVAEEVLDMYSPIVGDLVSVLLEPFYFPGPYDFAGWRMQYKINTLLASKSWEKPFVIPPKLLLLIRTMQGLYAYARRSLTQINWNGLTRKCLE